MNHYKELQTFMQSTGQMCYLLSNTCPVFRLVRRFENHRVPFFRGCWIPNGRIGRDEKTKSSKNEVAGL